MVVAHHLSMVAADAFASGNGDYTVSVKSVKMNKSKATSITFTYTGGTVDKSKTVAPRNTERSLQQQQSGEGCNAGRELTAKYLKASVQFMFMHRMVYKRVKVTVK